MGAVGAIWGVAGFGLFLVWVLVRLTPLAVEATAYNWTWLQWSVLIVNTGLMAYLEGYRGFQKGFSPMVVARAIYLKDHPRLLHVLLAPIFCMGYFHATKRRKTRTTSLTVMIIIFIIIVRLLPQPWRGIIDVGVLVGLSWGLVSLVYFSVKAISARTIEVSAEVSESGA